MNTLNCTNEEITQATEAFDARTHEALRRAPLSLLLTLFNPLVLGGLTQHEASSTDWADTLRAICLDLTGLSKDKFEDLKKKLLIVIGIEIDRRFPVPA
jgi:hypothetical protein